MNYIENSAKWLLREMYIRPDQTTKVLSARFNLSPLEIFSSIQSQNEGGKYFKFSGLGEQGYPIFSPGNDGLRYLKSHPTIEMRNKKAKK